jgi:hypothetical protein
VLERHAQMEEVKQMLVKYPSGSLAVASVVQYSYVRVTFTVPLD